MERSLNHLPPSLGSGFEMITDYGPRYLRSANVHGDRRRSRNPDYRPAT